MELINRRTQYTVTNSGTNIALTGEIIIGSDNSVTSFGGSFSKVADSVSAGNFNFREYGDVCDSSVNGCPKLFSDEAIQLLDATVDAIKAQILQ